MGLLVLTPLLVIIVVVTRTADSSRRLEQAGSDPFSWAPQPKLHTIEAIHRYTNRTTPLDHYNPVGWPSMLVEPRRNPREAADGGDEDDDGSGSEEEEESAEDPDDEYGIEKVEHFWAQGDPDDLSVEMRMLAFIVKEANIPACGETAPKKNFNIEEDIGVVGNILGQDIFATKVDPLWYGHPNFDHDPEMKDFVKHDVCLLRLLCPVPRKYGRYPILPRGHFDDIEHFCCRESCTMVMMDVDRHKLFTLKEIPARDIGSPRHKYRMKVHEDPRLFAARVRRAAPAPGKKPPPGKASPKVAPVSPLSGDDLKKMRTRAMSNSLSDTDSKKLMKQARSSMSEAMTDAMRNMVGMITDKDKLAKQVQQMAKEDKSVMENPKEFKRQLGKRMFAESCEYMFPNFCRKWCRRNKDDYCPTCSKCYSCCSPCHCRPCNCPQPPPCRCPPPVQCPYCPPQIRCPQCPVCPPPGPQCPPPPPPCPPPPVCPPPPPPTVCPVCPTCEVCPVCPPPITDPAAELMGSVTKLMEMGFNEMSSCRPGAKLDRGPCPPTGTPVIKDDVLIALVSSTCEEELPNIPLRYTNINDNAAWLAELDIKWD
uniref:Uncharacterized protein n=1 Tax=Trichogramma kaykai TaxID=54128 RepID=A0ABD2X7G9_9HYME